MVDYTTNHELVKPIEFGNEDEWGGIVNAELIEVLDRLVVVRDADDSRGNYTPYGGALYVATDTGTVYRGTGSSWNSIGSLNGDGGSTTLSVLDNGSLVRDDVDEINFTTNADVSDTGTGSVSVSSPLTTHDHSGSSVGGNALRPGLLNGTLVPRTTPISNISGNSYVTNDTSSDPTQADGDVVFYVE